MPSTIHDPQSTDHDAGPKTFKIPKMSEADVHSTAGVAMGHLLGVYSSLCKELVVHRQQSSTHQRTSTQHAASSIPNDAPADVPIAKPAASTTPSIRPNALVTENTRGSNPAASIPANSGDNSDAPSQQNRDTKPCKGEWKSVIHHLASASDGVMEQQESSKGRRNLEVINELSKVMDSQRAFRNRLHALKHQELAKFQEESSGGASLDMDKIMDDGELQKVDEDEARSTVSFNKP
uniref:Uncharacterized protein n=1 Tax=Craspedostauros australis TaxID=1486917 RepID=A0A7R9WRK8_9STRA